MYTFKAVDPNSVFVCACIEVCNGGGVFSVPSIWPWAIIPPQSCHGHLCLFQCVCVCVWCPAGVWFGSAGLRRGLELWRAVHILLTDLLCSETFSPKNNKHDHHSGLRDVFTHNSGVLLNLSFIEFKRAPGKNKVLVCEDIHVTCALGTKS